MTDNDNLSNPNIALAFNDATKLQYINLNNKPPLYKIYPDLRAIPLPAVAEQPGPAMSTMDAIRGDSPGTNPLTLEKPGQPVVSLRGGDQARTTAGR